MSDHVHFRKFPDGEVIALFPHVPWSLRKDDIMSYIHVGQHGGADRSLIDELDPASKEEYTPLQAELERAPYHYNLEVLP